MTLPRRHFLHLAAGAAVLPGASQIVNAQGYPTRPVRIIVGYAPGIAPDVVTRLLAPFLSERLGQQIIVDNRPGAANNIATEAVVRAPADGYTLLLVPSTSTYNATLYDNLNFDLIRDIAPVASIAGAPFVMVVTPSFPAKTVPEFIAYAKANPSKINMASAGIGTASHVFGELFSMMAGVEMLHVPYRGNYYADLLSGQVQVAITNIATAIEHVRSGKLRALAVTTVTRLEMLPDIPAVAEFVPGYEASGWYGIAAPKRTSTEIIRKLNDEINAALDDPKFRTRLIDLGNVPMSMTSAEFGKFIADETKKWAKVIRTANIKPE
jgi:tripartite-type tricarboxylate transporter receptor subunit TctC